jgi:chemotaxis protein CheY-P-specific phosphatase CheC
MSASVADTLGAGGVGQRSIANFVKSVDALLPAEIGVSEYQAAPPSEIANPPATIDGSDIIAMRDQARDMLEGFRGVDLASMEDVKVAQFHEMVKDTRQALSADFNEIEKSAKGELLTRLQHRNARAIASPLFDKIERVDQYTQYAFDIELLSEVAAMLPPDEAAKIIKFVPEKTTIIPAHYEPGAAVSIAAAIRKYGEASEVGEKLTRAMTRSKVGETVEIKPLKAPKPPLGGTA